VGPRDHDLRGIVAAEGIKRHAHCDSGLLGSQGPVHVLRGGDLVHRELLREIADKPVEIDVA
jgi:hypothetical protein